MFKENKHDFKVTIKEHPAKRGYVKGIIDSNVTVSELDARDLIEQNDYIFAPYSSSVVVDLYYSNKKFFFI